VGCPGVAGVGKSWDETGSARTRAGRPGSGSKWRSPTSSRPGWESGARGTAGEQRLVFIPPVLSPAAPRCLPALDCSCIFSASAVYWVTLVQTRTQRASHPARPFPRRQHHEPLAGPKGHSNAIDPGWESTHSGVSVGRGRPEPPGHPPLRRLGDGTLGRALGLSALPTLQSHQL